MSPILTVLMTTYNESSEMISNAISSILAQTYSDFVFLIIVDNKDNKEAIKTICSFAEKDNRIKYLVNKTNMGLAKSLNRGIENIDTKYIARMDADDFSLPDRLEKQITFMEKNEDVALLGSNIVYVDDNNKTISNRGTIPTSFKDIKQIAKFQNVMSHPTFFGRTSVFKTYHYRNLKYSQDYDLTCRLLESGEVLCNLPEYLLRYRVNAKVSDDKIISQIITRYEIRKAFRNHLLCSLDISRIVNKRLKSVNKEKLLCAIKMYDNSMNVYRNGKKLKAFFILVKAGLKSRIIFSEIENAIALFILKRRWRK